MSRWTDPEWLGSAYAWIENSLDHLGLHRVGDIDQTHVRIWSTVLRVPTNSGTIWFKANMDELRQEAAIADLVSSRRPDLVLPPLAIDRATGWMLMPDAGEQLRVVAERERSLHRWRDVLTRYADLQIDVMESTEALLEAGAPDMRFSRLREGFDALLERVSDLDPRLADSGPAVDELVERLAAFGVPDSVQHDDLHDAQVFVKDGQNLVTDWGDACVSHPFFTLAVTLEGVISWGLDDEEDSEDTRPYRDAYLAPYRARFDGNLDEAVDLALRLGWVCRAVNGHVPGDDGPTRTRLKMFLDGKP
jgi:hypothetical protein